MMEAKSVNSFKDLEAYKQSKKLAVHIYGITTNWSKEEMFGLTSQMRRASVSIGSNLAEGCGRSSSKDTLHFMFIARGSSYELEMQTEIAHELNLISTETLQATILLIQQVQKLLSGLIRRYKGL